MTSLPCADLCGVGTSVCIDGVWGECVVPPIEETCQGKCGEGARVCRDGGWSRCNAPPELPPSLTAIIRDFRADGVDFEGPLGQVEYGLLADELGPDDKPVFIGPSKSISSAAAFDSWYRDVPGVNLSTTLLLPLTPSSSDPRLFRYDGEDFFPIDDQLFGNDGFWHNYHFTLEASGTFVYQGGETFRFTGDDDCWVFINRRLAIDLGGMHQKMSAEVHLDDAAATLGLVLGQEYPLHLFFAERHTVGSNLVLETSIGDIGVCPG